MLEIKELLSRYGYRFEEKSSDWAGYNAVNPSEDGVNYLTMPFYDILAGVIDNNIVSSGGNVGIIWTRSEINGNSSFWLAYTPIVVHEEWTYVKNGGVSLCCYSVTERPTEIPTDIVSNIDKCRISEKSSGESCIVFCARRPIVGFGP